MSYNNTDCSRILPQYLVDAPGKFQPFRGGNIAAVDIQKLLRMNLGNPRDLRDSGNHLFNRKMTVCVVVVDEVGAGITNARNAATGSKNIN